MLIQPKLFKRNQRSMTQKIIIEKTIESYRYRSKLGKRIFSLIFFQNYNIKGMQTSVLLN